MSDQSWLESRNEAAAQYKEKTEKYFQNAEKDLVDPARLASIETRGFERGTEWARMRQALEQSAQYPDEKAVDAFAKKMKEKLAKSRETGRGGWDDPQVCTPNSLSQMLHEHVQKGDPVDVANFCMMLHARGFSIFSDESSENIRIKQLIEDKRMLLKAIMTRDSELSALHSTVANRGPSEGEVLEREELLRACAVITDIVDVLESGGDISELSQHTNEIYELLKAYRKVKGADGGSV